MSDAIRALEEVHHTAYPPPVQEVPVPDEFKELPPIEELPSTEELPPIEEDYSEEYVPEPEEIDNREEDTGQNVDTFA